MRQRAATLATTAAALLLAILETSPRELVNLNWDNGGYVADLATFQNSLTRPWSAHFAIAPLYSFFADVTHIFHGTVFDGVRLATICVFTLGAFLLADLVATITDSPAATTGLGCFFATFWVNQFLLLTVEDNLLYVPLLILLFRLSLLHEDRFRRRDALAAGALAGLAFMLSLQALLYAFPALWLCLLARPAHGDAIAPRLGSVGLAILGGAAAIVGVVLAMALGRAHLGTLVDILLAPPSPPLAMRQASDWLGAFDALGWAAGLSITHTGYYPPPTFGLTRTSLGLAFVLVVAIYAAYLGWRAWRTRSVTLGLVALTLVGFTCATPLRVDDGYAYLKRFDFMPACLALGIALLVGRRARTATVVGAVALVLAGVQLGLGLTWSKAHREGYSALECPPPPVHPVTANYGRDGKSWVAYFRDIREAHPDACAYVFDLDELDEGKWWQEIPGALWSELPSHVALGMKSRSQQWRFPPRIVDPRLRDDAKWHRPCAFLTCAARHRLAHP